VRIAGRLAGLGALLTLAVVAASAAIRLGVDELGATIAMVRGVHRAAASLAALLVVILFWRALRLHALRRAASVAFVLMLALSAVGWATGTEPPPAAALFNQLGGVALAGLLAWIAGRSGVGGRASHAARALARLALALAMLQVVFGAGLVLLGSAVGLVLLIAHAVCGLAAAAIVAALGVHFVQTGATARGSLLLSCAALAPLAGTLSAMPASVLTIQVAHAAAAALLVSVAAHAQGQSARSA
jgi:hypothetical protein